MRSDVPFGAFLSGGLDSSSIVALMSEISPFPIETFTIGYNEKEFDERKLAGLVAKKFNTNHFEKIITEDLLEDSLDKIILHYDEPFGDSSAIPVGDVSKFAARHVKMVLTGDGGDEILSGYPSYQGIKLAQTYQQFPGFLQYVMSSSLNLISKLSLGSNRYKINRYYHFINNSKYEFPIRLIAKRSKPEFNKIKALINDDIKTWPVKDYINDFMSKCEYKNDFYKEMFFNFKFDLPNDYLVKIDRMSMAYSLETRLPFLDHRLIEFMVRVDKDIKMQGLECKSVLKKTIAKKLPPSLLKSPKKGFRVPVREWFKSTGYQKKLSKIGSRNSFLNPLEFQKFVDENNKGIYDHGNLIWSIMVLDKIINK
jgi:asparagine synthase (glutamine-hydrolysing)